MALIGVYGASGFGREVMPLVQRAYGDASRVVFIDDGVELSAIGEREVMSYEEFLGQNEPDKQVSVAIADSRVRERLEDRCRRDGLSLLTIHAENVVMGTNCDVAEGAILCSFVCLTGDCRIGRSFHANIYSYVAHDCVIGDFVTFAPAVKCNGNVHIGNHAYIGTGAIIRQGKHGAPLRIGDGAIVGMGAVVTRDVAPGTTVVGNPARPMERP